MDKKCTECGKPVSARRAKVNDRFCRAACEKKFFDRRKAKAILICDVCGEFRMITSSGLLCDGEGCSKRVSPLIKVDRSLLLRMFPRQEIRRGGLPGTLDGLLKKVDAGDAT